MNDRPLQLALREVRGIYSSPRTLAIMAVIAVALGMAGPFGTFVDLAIGPRFAYWVAVVFSTYGVGTFFAWIVLTLLGERVKSRWANVLVIGLSSSLPVTLTVALLDLVFLANDFVAPARLAVLWSYCLVIAMGIGLIIVLTQPEAAAAAPAVEKAPPGILARLPLQARGKLSHMSMQDHYVDIVTDRGHALVLLRLGDAMKETGEIEGLQIHRSHWIALQAVKRVHKAAGKISVEMADGTMLPISRGFVAAARERGLVT